jgi:hypothetical protein
VFGVASEAILFWDAAQPTLFWDAAQPTLFWDAAQHTLFWDATQPTFFWDAAQPILFWDAAQPTLFWDAAQPTLFWDAAHPTLFWDAAQPTVFSRWRQSFLQDVGTILPNYKPKKRASFTVRSGRKLNYARKEGAARNIHKITILVPFMRLCSTENSLVSETDFFLIR